MVPHPCILGGPQTKGDKIRIGCLTPAFSGAQKRAQMLHHPSILGDPQTKGDKIRSGCLTPAFSGAQKRAQLLRHPCILGCPKEVKNATSPLHSRGSPNKEGTKSEVATSPLPSRGPKRGQKCYVTPTFSEVPNAKRGEKIRSGPHVGTSPTSMHFQ